MASTNSLKTLELDSSLAETMSKLYDEAQMNFFKTAREDVKWYRTEAEQTFYLRRCNLEEFLYKFFNQNSSDVQKSLPETQMWGRLISIKHCIDYPLQYENGAAFRWPEKQLHFLELRFARCIQRVYIITATGDNDVNFSFTSDPATSAQFKSATLVLGLFEKELTKGIIHPYVINMPTLQNILKKQPAGVHVKKVANTELYLVNAKEHFCELPCYDVVSKQILNKEELMKTLVPENPENPPIGSAKPLV